MHLEFQIRVNQQHFCAEQDVNELISTIASNSLIPRRSKGHTTRYTPFLKLWGAAFVEKTRQLYSTIEMTAMTLHFNEGDFSN